MATVSVGTKTTKLQMASASDPRGQTQAERAIGEIPVVLRIVAMMEKRMNIWRETNTDLAVTGLIDPRRLGGKEAARGLVLSAGRERPSALKEMNIALGAVIEAKGEENALARVRVMIETKRNVPRLVQNAEKDLVLRMLDPKDVTEADPVCGRSDASPVQLRNGASQAQPRSDLAVAKGTGIQERTGTARKEMAVNGTGRALGLDKSPRRA